MLFTQEQSLRKSLRLSLGKRVIYKGPKLYLTLVLRCDLQNPPLPGKCRRHVAIP